MNEKRSTKIISAQGASGQYIYILEDFDLVISFTERNYETSLVGSLIITDLIQ